jgi:large subunit ribosomal protein L15
MFNLATITGTSRPPKERKRIGRGFGSKRGRTAGRGTKGNGARSGYKSRHGYEGGQVPLYRKLPVRGFTRGTFAKPKYEVTLAMIEKAYSDGEKVNLDSLRFKGLIGRKSGRVKIVATGNLTRKLSLEAHALTAGAKEKLEALSIPVTLLE